MKPKAKFSEKRESQLANRDRRESGCRSNTSRSWRDRRTRERGCRNESQLANRDRRDSGCRSNARRSWRDRDRRRAAAHQSQSVRPQKAGARLHHKNFILRPQQLGLPD